MFDKETANLLQSAPTLNGLDPQYIPALLTRHYTYLASARLRGTDKDVNEVEGEWSLERIADTYELIVTLLSNSQLRKSAAFVAGTAQQILSRRPASKVSISHPEPLIRRDGVDPKISAALLFLAAGQYADANEAAASIPSHGDKEKLEIAILVECIADLARGKMVRILERVERWGSPRLGHNLEDNAFIVLLGALIYGLRNLAASFLLSESTSSTDTYKSARGIFVKVRELSTGKAISEGISIGYSDPNMISFASTFSSGMSRVQIHLMWRQQKTSAELEDWD